MTKKGWRRGAVFFLPNHSSDHAVKGKITINGDWVEVEYSNVKIDGELHRSS